MAAHPKMRRCSPIWVTTHRLKGTALRTRAGRRGGDLRKEAASPGIFSCGLDDIEKRKRLRQKKARDERRRERRIEMEENKKQGRCKWQPGMRLGVCVEMETLALRVGADGEGLKAHLE